MSRVLQIGQKIGLPVKIFVFLGWSIVNWCTNNFSFLRFNLILDIDRCSLHIRWNFIIIKPSWRNVWFNNYHQATFVAFQHIYMKPEVNSNRFEISLWDKISLLCEVTSLSAFTWLPSEGNSLRCNFHFGQIDQGEISNRSDLPCKQ